MVKIETKTVKTAHIKLNPDNPRRIGNVEMERLVKSLQEFPEMMKLREIVVDEGMTVLGGNMRLLALRKSGAKECTAKVVKGLTPEQKREFVIKDNAAFGEWDMDALANGWSDLPLAEWGVDLPKDTSTEVESDAEPATDRAIELNTTWKVSTGDLWSIGDHRLLCGDSTEDKAVALLFQGETPDMMVTDPPYGVKYDASWREEAGLSGPGIAKGKVQNDNRSKWCGTYIRSGSAVAYVWHAGKHSKDVQNDLESAGYIIRSQIIWAKKRFAISRVDYHWQHEPCWYAVKDGEGSNYNAGRKQSTLWADISDNFNPKGNDQIYAAQVDEKTIYAFNASMTTIWTIPNDKACDGGHSTQKPLECMARPIRNHGNAGDIVYDPFLGSGTTMVACQNLNRKCLGIEISPEYCAVILQRMTDAFPGIEIKKI